MAITDPMVLPPDVLLVPVAELADEVRGKLDGEAGDYALTRPRSRQSSRIVDARAAELLAEFRSPRTIGEAVLRYSRARGTDPEATLEESFPLLQALLDAGFLAPEGAAAPLGPTLAPGDELAGYTVRACVQSLDDTELYLVHGPYGPAALKIERAPGTPARELLAWEGNVLRQLTDVGVPRLLSEGVDGTEGDSEGRRYLALEWRSGVDALTAAAELRRQEDRAPLLDLCRAVATAYAGLHERGVLHGDVHPRNVLVAADGGVCLIDFGRAHRLGAGASAPEAPRRAGIGFFYEPELALSFLAGRRPPAPSPAGEQYGVAALLYLLLTGAHYRDFALEKQRMLRQVAEEPPLPFAERGVAPWPEIEAILARALRKSPGERFSSLSELASALNGGSWVGLNSRTADWLREAPEGGRPQNQTDPGPGRGRGTRAEALLARVLARLGSAAAPFALPSPCASINYGSAGIAYSLYRMALSREDPGLLATADLWAARAARETGEAGDDAFYDFAIGITPETVGRSSPYHSASGTWCVQALIAHAQGDPGGQRRALAAFVAAAELPCAGADLVSGRAGLLLASALLFPTLRSGGLDGGALRALGSELLGSLSRELAPLPPVPVCDERPNLGIAHGWAGFLYAALRWCQSTGEARPPWLAERLAELAFCAEPWGRGQRYRWYGESRRSTAGTMAGWCNGSAGLVHLWTLAHETLSEPAYLRLALGAAWNAWEAPERAGNLCCGLAGRAYALLHLSRHGGGGEWLKRARELAERAAADLSWAAERPDSLYKGEVGLALLAADLAHPEGAAMPFFEDEGWG